MADRSTAGLPPWIEQFAQFGFVEPGHLFGDGANGLTRFVSALGNFRGMIVPNLRSEGGAHGETLLDHCPATLVIGFQAGDATTRKHAAAISEKINGLQKIV